MSLHDSLTVFAALAADLQQQEPDEAVTARAIVGRMRDLVPEAGHVGLVLRSPRGGLTSLAGTDPLAQELDDLQCDLEQGPAVVVVGDGSWVRSGDVGDDARWPEWGAAAVERGVRSALTLGVHDRDEPLGAITLYAAERGGFADREVVDRARLYAVHAATAFAATRRATTLRAAVDSRHVIGIAQGIAMERFGIDQQQSFELLRRLSSTSNTKLRDVATQVAETREFPHEQVRAGD
ncbi:GAF and ANTAR domain-containing protein [Nocardioides okcheonensis]|uniref:GAF and ANTAR domain-containing protein n=1 Tax=Nocardioides okcheonensis TaxID=2894081 RepID=UPI001E49CBDE|nr:GAF and ANTAR domain-containing protein [Nocardioides okcheonensis]UFN43435.1 ANTAR domain-containing protein [Nocardioides okcheonensis]